MTSPDTTARQLLAAGRFPENPAEIVARAWDLIDRYGHAGPGYGSHTLGFSLQGAVYEAFNLIDNDLWLRDGPDVIFHQCDEVFQLIAAALGRPGCRLREAMEMVIKVSADWTTSTRWGESRTQVMELLATVHAELTEPVQAAA